VEIAEEIYYVAAVEVVDTVGDVAGANVGNVPLLAGSAQEEEPKEVETVGYWTIQHNR
jgi:hypothetical protein